MPLKTSHSYKTKSILGIKMAIPLWHLTSTMRGWVKICLQSFTLFIAPPFAAPPIKEWSRFPCPWIYDDLWLSLANRMWQKWQSTRTKPRSQESLSTSTPLPGTLPLPHETIGTQAMLLEAQSPATCIHPANIQPTVTCMDGAILHKAAPAYPSGHHRLMTKPS